MSDINQVVSLGIGSPAGIKYFITLGLGIGTPPLIVAEANVAFMPFRDKRSPVEFRDRRAHVVFRDKRTPVIGKE